MALASLRSTKKKTPEAAKNFSRFFEKLSPLSEEHCYEINQYKTEKGREKKEKNERACEREGKTFQGCIMKRRLRLKSVYEF